VQPIIAVRRYTVKISLPCAASRTHGNDNTHGKVWEQRTAMNPSTAKIDLAHGKETSHGKVQRKRTAMIG
jgi:hypothetical protein